VLLARGGGNHGRILSSDLPERAKRSWSTTGSIRPIRDDYDAEVELDGE
jgi:hypothetical protein